MKKVEIEDGEKLWIDESTIEGSKAVLCVGADEARAQELLKDLVTRFPSIASTLYRTMKTGFDDYGHSEDFPPDEFFVSISRMSPDVYMGDRSSLMLRFEFEEEDFSDTIPIYDFFLTDDLDIVHHQPVF